MALLELIRHTDWAAISAQMICDRADVARSTFCAHYPTRQDLLDDVFAAGAAEVADLSRAGGLEATLLWLAQHLETAAAFHRRLQGSAAGQTIMTRFRRQMQAQFALALNAEHCSTAPRDLEFATGGVFGVLEGWLAGGCREPARTLAGHLAVRMRQCLPVVGG